MAKLVECVPNFSVSKEQDPVVFQQIVDVANSVPGCTVLDVQTDGDHNRCVFTMVGSPAAIEEVCFQMTKKATELIDMTKHKGQHPRMGATDVIPFIPTMDMTVEECVEMSKRVAKRIWEELGVPIHFFAEENAKLWPLVLLFCNFWKGTGYSLIMYYAALGSLDTEQLEAAELDGANRAQKMWHPFCFQRVRL